MDWLYIIILVGAGLLVASSFTSLLAYRAGAPLLLVFLLVGLIAGEDGLGLPLGNAELVYFVGSLALAIILFDSGFSTPLSSLRPTAAPAILLATLGVLLTAFLLGVVAHFVLGLDWIRAFLIGAIVSSTDAAAVFFLLRVGGITLQQKVRSTLEVESASNDPMAIFLTMTLVALATGAASIESAALGLIGGFLLQMGLGAVFGIAGGYLIAAIGNRFEFERSLYPIVVIGMAMVLFAVTGLVGGSGFLAVYVAGIVAGNRRMRGAAGLRRFQEGMTWLAQIVMFLLLGLYAKPSEFLGVLVPALVVALALMLVARPVAVWLCLLPFGYKRREVAFIGWVGLRGAVSVLLAILPAVAGVEGADGLFNVAFIIVLVSLVVQGWSIRPAARLTGLVVPQTIGPVERVALELPGTAHHELIVYRVVDGSPVLSGQRIPRWARPSLVIRGGQSMRYQDAGRLRPDDYVYIFTSPRHIDLLDRLFASPAVLDLTDQMLVGSLEVDPASALETLALQHGIPVPEEFSKLSMADYIRHKLGGRRPEPGDRVECGPLDIVVRETDTEGQVVAAGLAIHRDHDEPEATLRARARALWQRGTGTREG